jgi:hypothetical protein
MQSVRITQFLTSTVLIYPWFVCKVSLHGSYGTRPYDCHCVESRIIAVTLKVHVPLLCTCIHEHACYICYMCHAALRILLLRCGSDRPEHTHNINAALHVAHEHVHTCTHTRVCSHVTRLLASCPAGCVSSFLLDFWQIPAEKPAADNAVGREVAVRS